MSTVWVRLNAVVFFGLSVLLTLSCLAALSKQFTHDGRPIVNKLELNSIRSLKPHGGVDRALFSFNMDVDLRPAFHWNVHQLFVYVVAQYETETAAVNHVVIWDNIVPAASPTKVLKKQNAVCKYAIVDPAQNLRGRNITLQLQWDHMPITGILHIDKQDIGTASSFVLPSEYQ